MLVSVLVLVGFGLVAYGVGMFSRPAGFIASGVLLVVYAIVALADVSGGRS